MSIIKKFSNWFMSLKDLKEADKMLDQATLEIEKFRQQKEWEAIPVDPVWIKLAESFEKDEWTMENQPGGQWIQQSSLVRVVDGLVVKHRLNVKVIDLKSMHQFTITELFMTANARETVDIVLPAFKTLTTKIHEAKVRSEKARAQLLKERYRLI